MTRREAAYNTGCHPHKCQAGVRTHAKHKCNGAPEQAERAERAQLRGAAVREAQGGWGGRWDEACSGAAEPVSAFEGDEGQAGFDEGYPDDGASALVSFCRSAGNLPLC